MNSMHIGVFASLIPFISPAAAVQEVRHRRVIAKAPVSPVFGHRSGLTSFMKKATNRRCNHAETSAHVGEDGFETGVSTGEENTLRATLRGGATGASTKSRREGVRS